MFHCLLLMLLAINPPVDKEAVVVENDKAPVGKAYTLAFEEDLRFGADEDSDEYLWASIKVDLAVNDQGHIFIADPKSNEVRQFDENGKFVRKVAGAGGGPGEMVAVNKVQFLADGRLAVFEAKPMVMPRIQYFDKDGRFLTSSSSCALTAAPRARLAFPHLAF